jgi:hypothetical protein
MKGRRTPTAPTDRRARTGKRAVESGSEELAILSDVPPTGTTANSLSLLCKLETYVAAKAGRAFSTFDRRFLDFTILGAREIYGHGMRSQAFPSTLHTLREPIAHVIRILRHSQNVAEILIAFGAPQSIRSPLVLNLLKSRDPKAMDRALSRLQDLQRKSGQSRAGLAIGARLLLAGGSDQPAARYEALLRDLDQIAAIIPPDPEGPGRGRPNNTRALFAVVQLLVDYWERATGTRFTADWQRGKPFNDATRFIVETIQNIAPERLKSLPRLTAEIIRSRRTSR